MILSGCFFVALSSFGQQALGQRPRVSSPIVNQDGTVTFNAGAHLQVNDFSYLVNGNYETFLDATDNVGTFATSNLEKPYGWTLRNGHGQVYQTNGFMLIFR